MPRDGNRLRAEKSCPLPEAHTRLHQAHDLWHRAAAAYADPDEFVLVLNQLLVTLRQVTFMLQKRKAEIPDFAAWYDAWRERMASDPLMIWLRDARNTVEKVGDLDLASTARVTMIADWVDHRYVDLEVPAALDPAAIATLFSGERLPEPVRKEGLLRVERRWVSRDLPDYELTEVCAHGYGVMSTIVAEAHERLGYAMHTFSGETHAGKYERVAHLGGRLPCMVMTAEQRTAQVKLASGALVAAETLAIPRDSDDDAKLWAERMDKLAVARGAVAPRQGEDVLDWGGRWMSVARRVLATDGYHLPHAFLFDDAQQTVAMMELEFEDQAEKMLAIERVAREVDRLGAVTVILIDEAWMASAPDDGVDEHTVPARDRPDRTEGLVLIVATSDGRRRTYVCPFTRDGEGHPVLGETKVDTAEQFALLRPIEAVWARWPK